MKSGTRLALLALVSVAVLAASAAAKGGEADWRIAVIDNPACYGFAIENVKGVVSSCVHAAGGTYTADFAAAVNGSIVYRDEPSSYGGIRLATPAGPDYWLDSSAHAAQDFSPSISYDGSRVVFVRENFKTHASDIYSVNADGTGLRLVYSGRGTNYLGEPVISPDGSSVAFWCQPVNDLKWRARTCGPLTDGTHRYGGMMRVNLDGTDPRMIVIGSTQPSSLSWSPDSRWLATDEQVPVGVGHNLWTAQEQLFRYRTDGSDLFNGGDPVRQITHFTLRQDPSPAFAQFSPDGSELLYMSFVDGQGYEGNFSYLVGVDGSHPHQIFLEPPGPCTKKYGCDPMSYGAFVPTATPVAPPPIVDVTRLRVPSVARLRGRAATRRIRAHHLTIGRVSYAYSATVGEHRVASQYPPAGAVVHRFHQNGPHENLVLSLGPAPPGAPVCLVPRVRKERWLAAQRAILAANCTVGVVREVFSRKAGKGHVLSVQPGSGTTMRPFAQIAVTVSKGSPRCPGRWHLGRSAILLSPKAGWARPLERG